MNMQKIHKNINLLSDNELYIFAKKNKNDRTIREHMYTFKGLCENFAAIKKLVLNKKKKVFASLLVLLALNIKLSLPPC
jgi:hypothetical protein